MILGASLLFVIEVVMVAFYITQINIILAGTSMVLMALTAPVIWLRTGEDRD